MAEHISLVIFFFWGIKWGGQRRRGGKMEGEGGSEEDWQTVSSRTKGSEVNVTRKY